MEETNSSRLNNAIEERILDFQRKYNGEDLDLGYLLCDQHIKPTENVALVYKESVVHEISYSYKQLKEYSNKFASILSDMGVQKGDRVATLLPKSPELLISVLGIWRLGAVHVPLFTAFGPEAIDFRLKDSTTSILITDKNNRSKVGNITKGSKAISPLDTVIIVEKDELDAEKPEDVKFWTTIEKTTKEVKGVKVSGDDPFILLYTSGTTGAPKGVELPTKLLAPIEVYMRWGLDVQPEDVYWNMADPGWAYGLYYAIVGPLLIGKPTILFNAPFKVENALEVMINLKVSNLATSPTVFRVMKSAGISEEIKDRLSFRVASCAGEPLNPELLSWGQKYLGISIRDQFGQTELGMVVANLQSPELQLPLKQGSAGPSIPGFKAVIVDENGRELEPGNEGELAIDTKNSPLFCFDGYYKNPKKTKERFSEDGRYYLTGDAGSQDDEGYVFLTGRNDDVITSSGYRIGPYEIEGVLMGHQAVGEVAVIGVPDELRGEIVKAIIVLKERYTASKVLEEELRQLVKKRLSAHVYPREIAFVESLPKTPSGKIQRFLLRTQ